MSEHRLQRAREPIGMARARPLVGLALTSLVLHWVWEMLQAPLFASMQHVSVVKATWACTRASAGDVVITLIAYGTVAAAVRQRAWFLDLNAARVGGYLGVGLIVTVALEFLSTERWDRWSYAPGMPRAFGVGLAPLLQWVVVPLATLWALRGQHERAARWDLLSGASRGCRGRHQEHISDREA